MKAKHFKVVIAILVLAMLTIFLWPQGPLQGLVERLDKISWNPNEFIRHFAPTWRSLKKITDLPFAFYALRDTKLPIYEIRISALDQLRLLDNLPDFPDSTFQSDEFKNTIRGSFSAEGYHTDDARIRYRGNSPRHWNAVKKSWHVRLPPDSPLGARRIIRLVLPEDRLWIAEIINSHRAKKLGVITPELSFVRLHVNGNDSGVYLLMEGWEESLLDRNERSFGSIFTNSDTVTDLYRPSGLGGWHDRFSEELGEEKAHLEYLLWLIASAPDAVFEKNLPNILDMETFYNWTLVSLLAGSLNQSNFANANLYFNEATGKFEPVAFDVDFQLMEDSFVASGNRLVNRTLTIPSFRNVFEEKARSYLLKDENIKDDLALYDKLENMLKPEVYSDVQKLPTNFEFLDDIKKYRYIVEMNAKRLEAMLSNNKTLSIRFADETYPLGDDRDRTSSLERFLQIGASRAEFLFQNPQFISRGNREVVLTSRTHVFTETVIIPKGLTLVIEPGAKLLFADGVSLVSYSNVRAIGTAENPIAISGLNSGLPWGVFAVIGAPLESTFSFFNVREGSDDSINGIYFSGELSMHDTNAAFKKSTIRDAGADDGLHVLGGAIKISQSSFLSNSADSIDIDYTTGDSILANNLFTANNTVSPNGDAIDISFSNIVILENTLIGCGDKGVSVGERSSTTIERIVVTACPIGIAVKDGSKATIKEAYIFENDSGILLYRKKPHFIVGGSAIIINSVVWNNTIEVTTDVYSNAFLSKSTVKKGPYETRANEHESEIDSFITSLPLSWVRGKNLITR